MKKLLVFAVIAMVAGAAMAEKYDYGTYGWWNTWVTIAGESSDVTLWSTDSGNGTYLGTLALDGQVFNIQSAQGNIWSNNRDRGGINFHFNTYINTVQDADDQTSGNWWLGSLTPDPVKDTDYSFAVGASGPLGNVELKEGDTVGLVLYAKTYSGLDGGDEWYGAGGNNYHAYFTVGAAPIPEPATMGLVGLGALVLALRRKLSK